MNKLMTGLAAAGLMAMTTSAAFADGLPDYSAPSVKDAPVACCSTNWNGLYIGAAVGAGAVITSIDSVVPGSTGSLDGLGGQGILGAVTLGYDRVLRDGLVLGVFGEYSFGREKFSDSIGATLPLGTNVSWDKKDAWAVGARLGLVRNCCTMWYGTVGYTHADFDLSTTPAAPTLKVNDSLDGWFVGAGVESAIRDNWFLKLEYRYSMYNGGDISFNNYKVAGFDVDEHSIRLGISYKFDLHRDRVEPLK